VENNIGAIKVADLDGSNVRVILTGLSDGIRDIEVDSQAAKIYWVESDPPAAGADDSAAIWQANLNGSGAKKIREINAVSIEYIELDVLGGKIYWRELAGLNAGMIMRADKNGSAIEQLVVAMGIYGLAVNRSENRLYFINSLGISSIPCNPSYDITDVTPVDCLANGGLELDTANGKMYWTEWAVSNGIQRADLDGNNKEKVVNDVRCTDPFDLALDLTEGKIYWSDRNVGIVRSNLDGTGIEILFPIHNPNIDQAFGIVLYK